MAGPSPSSFPGYNSLWFFEDLPARHNLQVTMADQSTIYKRHSDWGINDRRRNLSLDQTNLPHDTKRRHTDLLP